jgi:hypothetical protein
MASRCQLYSLRKDMAGGVLKKGMEVWALHHIRIFVPLAAIQKAHPQEPSALTVEFNGRHLQPHQINSNEVKDLVASFDVDGQLFSDYFERVLPQETYEPLIVPM